MTPWKRFLLSLYCNLGAYWRQQMIAELEERQQAPWIVLFYHRVADDRPNDWTLANAEFARQMHWLRERYEMISFAEGQQRIASGRNSRLAVTITFDDGYADNCDAAMPLLVSLGIPCTYFVSSKNILSNQPFPHDLKRGQPLAPNTPQQIRELSDAGIDIGAHTRTHADLGSIATLEQLRDELLNSQRDLEQLVGREVRFFAFPYGQHANLSAAAFELARGTYAGVCSAYGGYNFPGEDAFHIQRIAVDDELIRLKNWLTLDPRKVRASRRDRYVPPYPDYTRPVDAVDVRELELALEQEATL